MKNVPTYTQLYFSKTVESFFFSKKRNGIKFSNFLSFDHFILHIKLQNFFNIKFQSLEIPFGSGDTMYETCINK